MALTRCRAPFNRPVFIVIVVTFGTLYLMYASRIWPFSDPYVFNVEKLLRELPEESKIFQGFNNETGSENMIVPNIIHSLRLKFKVYTFVDYLCLQAAFRHHRPDFIYIHTDVGDQFTGKYWNWIQQDEELKSRIKIIPISVPTKIFGQRFNKDWHLHHVSDILRVEILIKYGGIYLDNDVFVIKGLDKYRKYEMTLNWDENQFLGTQLYLAHKDARFLKLYLETYRNKYDKTKWYYNAGERPTVEILYHYPELIHRVKWQFGADVDLSGKLYKDPEMDWRSLDAIHLMINHRNYMDPRYKEIPLFDESNIKTYPYPFGEMAREIVGELEKEPWFQKLNVKKE